MNHRQLTEPQRYQISCLHELEMSSRKMAKIVGVDKTTINRELKRNTLRQNYDPEEAHGFCIARRTYARKSRKITLEIERLIIFFLQHGYSPKKISIILAQSFDIKLAFQTIYNHIETDRKHGGDLYKLLPFRGRAKRSDYIYKPWKKGVSPELHIDHRCNAANERSRIGHLEIDTIISKDRKGGVLTVVDRKTRYLWAKIIPNMNAKTVSDALIELLEPHKDKVKTITSDNGLEFAKYTEITKALNCKYYFCTPYSSWERGSVERLNRDIRTLYPKRTDFLNIDETLFKAHIQMINHKPRECLNMKSPHNAFWKTGEFWQQNEVVRLLLESRKNT